MKRDMDTVAISLNDETLYLQILRTFHEDTGKWQQWRQVPHSHTVYELHILRKGFSRLSIGGQVIALSPGQAVLIAPGQYHEPFSLEGAFERLSFFFMPDEKAESIHAILQERIPAYLVFRATTAMMEISGMILHDWIEKNPYRKDMRRAMLTTLMIMVFRHLGMVNKSPVDVSGEPPRLFLCDDYFTEKKDKKSIKELAQYLQMSERQVNRCLMEFYGMSFQQKLAQTRMEQAAWLLCTTDQNVNEIAGAVGYDSESGFYKVFRRHYQMTPQQYRKKYGIQENGL